MRKLLSALQKTIFFKRLIPSILRRLPFNRSINIKIKNFDINLNLESSNDRYIYLNGFYDKKQINFVESEIDLNRFDYFLDIGSNIGFYSLYFASKYKNLNILAFEPIHENYNQIEKSIAINEFKKIEVFKYALSNKKDSKIMWVTDMKKKSGFSVYEDEDYKNEISVNNYDSDKIFKRSINSEIFDDKFKIENKKIFIKIDVERHEFQCISGMLNLLKNHNNKIFIQIEIIENYKDKVLNLLKDINFRVVNEVKTDVKNVSYGSDYYLTNF
ncbi:FkbM family methyltransferase [Pelagibacterales bacterium SAG-MED21]|nr:FkbM family methyltransferase [Pelagibacterales bacterium SAG-MED21]